MTKHSILAGLILSVFIASCSRSKGDDALSPYGGINTGNPDVKSNPPKTSDTILTSHCKRLKECRSGFDEALCNTNGKTAQSFKASFSNSQFPNVETLEGLKQLEIQKAVYFDTNQLKICLNHVETIPCSEAKVGNAWSPSNALDFSKIFLLSLGANSCKEVLRAP